MALHRNDLEEIGRLAMAPVYARPRAAIGAPKEVIPEDGMDPRVAYRLIHDELMLDGNSRQNVATFVTTFVDEEADRLFAETADKNMIDKDEYPQTAEIEGRATTPVEELLDLSFLLPDRVTDSLHAYQLAKRGNSLRVMAEAVRWGNRGARINTISPGIIITPLARDELTGPRGAGYRRMIEVSAAGRPGTPDEVGNVAALLMGPDGGFITGSDILMDGGVTAAFWFGELAHG